MPDGFATYCEIEKREQVDYKVCALNLEIILWEGERKPHIKS